MEKRPSPNEGNPSAADKRNFKGTSNPRHLRVLMALLVRPRPREAVDEVAGASNGPDLIAQLRERGLSIPCTPTPCIDRDGFEVRRGIYCLDDRDRCMVRAWLRRRERALKNKRTANGQA